MVTNPVGITEQLCIGERDGVNGQRRLLQLICDELELAHLWRVCKQLCDELVFGKLNDEHRLHLQLDSDELFDELELAHLWRVCKQLCDELVFGERDGDNEHRLHLQLDSDELFDELELAHL